MSAIDGKLALAALILTVMLVVSPFAHADRADSAARPAIVTYGR